MATKQTPFRLSDSHLSRLDTIAESWGLNRSEAIRRFIDEKWARNDVLSGLSFLELTDKQAAELAQLLSAWLESLE